MLNVSVVPGSPQSLTSTLKDSVVVPVDRVTAAVPANLARVFAPQLPSSITSASMDWAFIRTPASWSLYSRFPAAGQHLTEKPNVAFAVGLAELGINAGNES